MISKSLKLKEKQLRRLVRMNKRAETDLDTSIAQKKAVEKRYINLVKRRSQIDVQIKTTQNPVEKTTLRAQKVDFTGRMKNARKQIKRVEKVIKSFEVKVSINKMRIEDLTEQIKYLNNKIHYLNKFFNKTNNEIVEEKKKYLSLWDNYHLAVKEIKEMEESLKKLNERLANMTNENDIEEAKHLRAEIMKELSKRRSNVEESQNALEDFVIPKLHRVEKIKSKRDEQVKELTMKLEEKTTEKRKQKDIIVKLMKELEDEKNGDIVDVERIQELNEEIEKRMNKIKILKQKIFKFKRLRKEIIAVASKKINLVQKNYENKLIQSNEKKLAEGSKKCQVMMNEMVKLKDYKKTLTTERLIKEVDVKINATLLQYEECISNNLVIQKRLERYERQKNERLRRIKERLYNSKKYYSLKLYDLKKLEQKRRMTIRSCKNDNERKIALESFSKVFNRMNKNKKKINQISLRIRKIQEGQMIKINRDCQNMFDDIDKMNREKIQTKMNILKFIDVLKSKNVILEKKFKGEIARGQAIALKTEQIVKEKELNSTQTEIAELKKEIAQLKNSTSTFDKLKLIGAGCLGSLHGEERCIM